VPGEQYRIPSGTVTFLFSDVVGSTRLWAADPEAMSASLRLHDQIFNETIAKYEGHVFSTAGDSFAVAFARASAAVDCAEAIQRSLGGVNWGTWPALSVRIGLHQGEAEERDDNYFGPTVNQAARVMAVAHGGQTLLTDGVRDASSAVVTDLGTHALRDIETSVHLNQLGTDEFPPLLSLGQGIVSLPLPRTSLVGRDEAIEEVRRIAAAHRLVTLVGVGGCGKTRLAIEVAHREVPSYPMGVWFVDLSAIADEGALPGALATALSVTISTTSPPIDQISAYLSTREALLVIDNCEHVIDPSAELVDILLQRCPELRIVATSRESLEVDGEYTWKVPSLGVGDHAPAVQLFCERAAAAGGVVGEDQGGVAAVTEVVERLDGIPLAIELAAARTRTMSVEEIRDLLDDRFSLLSGGARRSRQRQATLEGAVQWSYDLLTADEQAILRSLSVFQGGFSVPDVAAVVERSEHDTRQLIDTLAAKSLVDITRDATGQVRHRLLETIRLFALARLVDAEEAVATRDRHLHHFDDHGEHLSVARWWAMDEVMRSEREYENFRSAIAWALERDCPEAAVRIAAARFEATSARGEVHLVLAMLERPADLPPGDRAYVAAVRVWLLVSNGLIVEALAGIDQARDLGRAATGDHEVLLLLADGTVQAFLGGLNEWGDSIEEARRRATISDDALLVAGCDLFRASHLTQIGRHDEAIEVARAALLTAPNFGSRSVIEAGLCWSLLEAGRVEEAARTVRRFTPSPIGSPWSYFNDITANLVLAHTDAPETAGRAIARQTQEVLARRPEIGGEFLAAFAYLHLLSGRRERALELIKSAVPVALGPVKTFILVGGRELTVAERIKRVEEEAFANPASDAYARYAEHGARLVADEIGYWSTGGA